MKQLSRGHVTREDIERLRRDLAVERARAAMAESPFQRADRLLERLIYLVRESRNN